VLTYDATTPLDGGFWTMEADPESLTVEIHYFDADLAEGERAWTLSPESSGCVVNDY
jgi:hypothetical protein